MADKQITVGEALVLYGSDDPTAGAGVTAVVGSLYLKDSGVLYQKTGAASTAWALVGFNNPMTTLGDIIFGGVSGVQTRLAGNTGLWRKKLTQTGDGTNSAAPSWVNDSVLLYMSGGDQTTTAATVQNITNLAISVEANSKYYIEGFIHIGCNNTGGVQFATAIPAAATIWVNLHGFSTGGGVFLANPLTASATLNGTGYCRVNNANGGVLYSGTVTTGANAGTIQIQFASSVGGQTSTIYSEGTTLKVMKLN